MVTHRDALDGPEGDVAFAAADADAGSSGCDAEYILCLYSSTWLPGYLDNERSHSLKITHKHSFRADHRH